MDVDATVAGAVKQASGIEGWMSEEELAWLAEMAVTRDRIVEVGSWKGRSTTALALATHGRVYAVDHWRGSANERETTHREAVDTGSDAMFATFCSNVAPLIALGKLVPMRQDGALAASSLREILGENGADLVFIDAEHTDDGVRRDIANYRKLCGPGAILCGHDYNYEPVARAVRGVFVEGIGHGAGSIWMVRMA